MAGDTQPDTELCRLEVEGAVANLTLDRTDAFNALNPQLISEMSEPRDWRAPLPRWLPEPPSHSDQSRG